MKILLLTLLVILSLQAEITHGETKTHDGKQITKLCIDNYRFILIHSIHENRAPTSLIQMFEKSIHPKYAPQPMKCK